MTDYPSPASLKDALEDIADTTSAEYIRLRSLREAGDLWYDPNPCSVFVWQLSIARIERGYAEHAFSQLFSTRELALRAACEEIANAFGSMWREEWSTSVDLVKLIDEGKFEEALENFTTHYSSRRFELRLVEVETTQRKDR